MSQCNERQEHRKGAKHRISKPATIAWMRSRISDARFGPVWLGRWDRAHLAGQ
jgi:hypothetical protein